MVYPSNLPEVRIVYNTVTKEVESYRGLVEGNTLPTHIQAAPGDLYYRLEGKTFNKEGSLYKRLRAKDGKLSMILFKQCNHKMVQVSCSNPTPPRRRD